MIWSVSVWVIITVAIMAIASVSTVEAIVGVRVVIVSQMVAMSDSVMQIVNQASLLFQVVVI